MATHSSIHAWRITWTKKPGGLQSMRSHRVGHNWSDLACMHKRRCVRMSIALFSYIELMWIWVFIPIDEQGLLLSFFSHGTWKIGDLSSSVHRGHHWQLTVQPTWGKLGSSLLPCLVWSPESLPRPGTLVPRVQHSQEPLAVIFFLDLAFFLGLHQRVG